MKKILLLITLLFSFISFSQVYNSKEYQSKEGLQNEKGLDRYIDKILTEKAERNN